MRFIVSIPVWGDAFTDIYRRTALPAIRRAAAALGPDDTVIIEDHAPPAGRQWFERMSAAHRASLQSAEVGDVVVLLAGDMVISSNTFLSLKLVLSTGKKMVVCNSTRSILENYQRSIPTNGVRLSSRPLSKFGWDNRHQITEDSVWPDGRADDLIRVYWERDGNVVTRQWLPHPLAVLVDGRPLKFGPTIDCDLITNFTPSEIHVVTDPGELAVIELSPLDKAHGSRDDREPPMRTGLAPLSERYPHLPPLSPDVYRYVLSKRIVVVGQDQDCGDAAAVRRLL